MATDIQITDLTTGTIDGTGVFDKLIQSVTVHFEDQFNKGHISTTEYGNAYAVAMQSVLAQSLQYILQEKTVEKQVDLLTEQIATQEAQTASVLSDTAIKEAQSVKELLLKDAQIANLEAQIALTDQKLKTELAEINTSVDGVEVSGRIGSQTNLYKTQADAMLRDAEQKAASIMADIMNVLISVDNPYTTEYDNIGVDSNGLKNVFDKLKNGIGITTT